MGKRSPGRPHKPLISRERILDAALARIERDGLAAMTMNGLARELGVAPMALYHYVADRDALLEELAAQAYAPLRTRPQPARTEWDRALFELAIFYLDILARVGELLRYFAASPRAARIPTELFAAHVHAALAPLELARAARRTAHDVYVDFVHGFSLGVPRTGLTPALRRALRAELDVVCMGIGQLRPRTSRNTR